MIEIKTGSEIEKIRASCEVVTEFILGVKEVLKPGMRTKDIEEIAWETARRKGARPAFFEYMGYPAACCVSLNEEILHGIPSDKVIKEGDIVSVDFGVEIDGFYGDGAWTFAVGEIKPEVQRFLEVARQALYAGIDFAKPGKRVGDISSAVQTLVESRGFNVVRDYCGHGIGRKLHEDPPVPNYGRKGTGPKLVHGMVLCIESMVCMGLYDVELKSDGWTAVTKDGSLTAHFEHTVAILSSGSEILTGYR